MNINPYIEDILSQPEELKNILHNLDLTPLKPIKQLIEQGQIDRIVITGMGASLYGIYPAWMLLTQAGFSAFWVDTAELAHYLPNLITPRTLLWMVSQSGRSAELMHFFGQSALPKPRMIFAITNDLSSSLAKAAEVILPINTRAELTVSTRTYLNTLAISQLVAMELTGKSTQSGFEELIQATDSIKTYLENWQAHVETLKQIIGLPRNLVILGRGASLAAAYTGALIIGEASKFPALALNAAEFRHGPLELVNPDLSVMILAGADATLALNRRLADDIARLGGLAYWVSPQPELDIPLIQMPSSAGLGMPVAEIVPFQILSLAVAQLKGIEPGKFYQSGKITLTE
jgi:glucosamine--fructose-6-phosphate aminotransferase (isomerizing)